MIEWIIGGTTMIALIFYFRDKIWTGLKKFFAWLNFDRTKFDVDDIVEVYDMLSDFITGGIDGKIDIADALILSDRLQAWIISNKKEQIEEDVELVEPEEL